MIFQALFEQYYISQVVDSVQVGVELYVYQVGRGRVICLSSR